MDALRYWVALYILVFWPGAFLFWFSIHPFIAYWRKLGVRTTLALHYAAILLLAVVVFLLRRPLLAVDFGTRPVLVVVGICCLMVAIILRIPISRQLSSKRLTGLPELAPDRYDSRLLTDGVYAHVRHPRYLQATLAMLAFALFCNFLALWIGFGLSIVIILLIIPLEERELRDRFGEEYDRYCERVPRLSPRWRKAA